MHQNLGPIISDNNKAPLTNRDFRIHQCYINVNQPSCKKKEIEIEPDKKEEKKEISITNVNLLE